jgi:gamma-glutamylcyclotransferase (GGCT)/AIG2-like uncharacterized protein YtfP
MSTSVDIGSRTVTINGKVFRITEAELKAADEYEVSDYKRIHVQLRSGNAAWVYVRA